MKDGKRKGERRRHEEDEQVMREKRNRRRHHHHVTIVRKSKAKGMLSSSAGLKDSRTALLAGCLCPARRDEAGSGAAR